MARRAVFILAAALCAPLFAGSAFAQPVVRPPPPAPKPVPVVPPELTRYAAPEYPEIAKREGREAVVVLRLTVNAEGRVTRAEVHRSGGAAFDRAAVAAAQRLEFTPAKKGDQAVAAVILFRYAFELDETAPESDEAPVNGALAGKVLTGAEEVPVAGARVLLRDARGEERAARTDAEGRFRFTELPPGGYRVEVSAAGHEPLALRETVEPGEALEVRYRITVSRTDVIDVTVRGERPPREVVKRTLTRREIDRIPGTRGDALRSIQTLPGVARVPGDLGLLIVRGSAPQDTLTFIDGTPVPLIYHFGGLSSVVPTELIDRIDFYPGNFSARFGRAQGGIVDAGLRSPRLDGYHGLAQIDLIDARVLAEGPIPLTESWSFAAAGRRSHIDAVLSAAAGEGPGQILQAPVYYDYQFLLEHRASESERFRLAFFGSDDAFELVVPPSEGNPTLSGNFDFHTAFQRLQLRYWNQGLEDQGRVSALVAGGREVVEVSLGQAFGILEVYSLTGRLEATQPLGRGVVVNVGTDLFHANVDVTLRLPAQVGGGNPASTRPFREVTLARDVSFPAAYAELELAPDERSRIVPGVRLDYYNILNRVDVSPRFNARYDFVPSFPRTTGKVGLGVYQQPPQYQEMVQPIGNPNLRSNTSIHYGIGLEQEITLQLEASAEFFYKQLDDQVDLEPSAEGQGVVFYDNGTRGYAVGGEFLLKYKPDERFFGWLAYTLSRSARQDRPSSDEQLIGFDQTHILSVLGSYELGWGWSFGARFRLVSGNINTPIVCDSSDPECDPNRIDGLYHGFSGRYVTLPRVRERERLPTFHQLDVRVDKRWEFELWKLSLYLDVQNVYNNRNIEGISYNFDYSGRQFSTGLPIIPSFGLRGEF